MDGSAKIDFAKACMQCNGNITIISTTYNYDKNGGINFRDIRLTAAHLLVW